ncbi:MAG: winged helix-turn-helix domain-containing protein [Bacteroides sp.]|nr:winged helix-turn-helix domain-containing protein [Roseburia sp.]MCM1347054.1 winged helix-turn-helix domain-containing protein [Bacteroides sp.]MCM1421736.1 winged helix-turn-helix domain-containing protein [Bacteroides sp.]
MLQEKAGNIAGIIWNALSDVEEGLTFKQIKKITKLAEKDFNLGLGWLLREDKVDVTETNDDKEPYIYSLK